MDHLSLLQGINVHIVTPPSLILALTGFRLAEFGDYAAFLLLLSQQELTICQRRQNNKKMLKNIISTKMTKNKN